MTALCDKTATELCGMLRRKEVTSREITESVFKRMEERESEVNAFITVTRDLAMEQADQADRNLQHGKDLSPLTGIPVAVKDVLCTRGLQTTCGSNILKGYTPPYDATSVERIKASGAVIVGKTNMDEFAMGSSNENSAFGPVRNPANTDYVAGGSSGGSAAAVAAGETILALGSDTGGSIRLPAAYCGITGIKPTYGRVSRYGLVAYASSLDQVGALGRSAADCALLLDVICGYDRRDSTSASMAVPGLFDALKKGMKKGLKIGLPQEYFVEGLDPRVEEKVREGIAVLKDRGADIVDISLPHARYAISAYYLIATAEAGSNLARYDGVKYGVRSDEASPDLIHMYEHARSRGFGDEVKRRIMLGTYVLSAGYYDAYYLKAQEARNLVRRDFERAFEQVDCMITPVSPCLPFPLGEKVDDPLQMYLVDIYTVSLNLAGLPGMSVDCGRVNDLPVGLQIIGRPFDEETVLQVGHTYENATGQTDHAI
ncbi:MAG: Asp-tRNA(Asn)/Glu-tRNA(Gln) amidotransferase subunit GatA [Deltaproteobacteria bacterium]|nr:Asp-tRNA(Asn)/Glu-tRNA(Gln) amidotransferase subunit GatA [Deltaproteobacteria bacterium]